MHFDIFYSILFHLKKVTIYYHKWVKNRHIKDTGQNEQLLHKGYNLSLWRGEQRQPWAPACGSRDDSVMTGAFADCGQVGVRQVDKTPSCHHSRKTLGTKARAGSE